MYKIEVKKLNDFNQLAKKVSLEYLVFHDNTIIYTNNDKHLKYGEHFGKLTIPVFNMIEENQIFCINSDSLFKIIRDNKKIIKQIMYLDNKLFLSDEKGEDKFQIGYILSIKTLSKHLYDLYKLALIKINEYNDDNSTKILTDDIIEKINNKKIVTFSLNEHKIRLTNKLIPLLKKTNKISIGFKDFNKNNLFESLLISETEYFNLFHRYICIKY